MEEIIIDQITSLLIEGVRYDTPEGFLQKCEKKGFRSKKPASDFWQYAALPPFDEIYQFEFSSPKAINSFLEIIRTRDKILQIGAHFHYPKNFLSNDGKCVFKKGKIILDDYFGKGFSTKSKNFKNINYGNENILGYISIIRMNLIGVIFKIANTKLYNEYYPIK